MNNIFKNCTYKTYREDSQECPVILNTDKETGETEAKQLSAPFFAFNKENYKAKVLLAREEPIANSIFEFFISEMDGTNAICISMAVLEKLFKLSRRTLSRHIKVLVDRKFVDIFKNGNMNIYAINAYIVWTKGDANLWRAKFKATMYLDYDEQTNQIKREYAKQITTK
ncbi:ArsR/SmtB family transcription factor [Vibrio aestuarianus]|uniref:Helix-turn-helix transcriptional regulator n=1 Tax=Vibrio aestuarianus TaxID=28171 RepID=A0ABD7YLW1_9VIBR|nr:helix-turn-helix transcriptional regulator [Vibrio aestuarianus]WGK85399.1 helix-turn-helix transcriptional regulator [Vibrio aestuarianus]CAH8217563.1 hypothetical protein VAEU17_4270005 [Vibrio aestuarianus]